MKSNFILIILLLFFYKLFPQKIEYSYDASGNRIIRKLINLKKSTVSSLDSIFKNQDSINYILEESFEKVILKIYPNPFSHYIKIEVENLQYINSAVCEIYNEQGKNVKISNIQNFPFYLSLSYLSPGRYILILTINKHRKEYIVIKD